jgi:hypothetical protein
VDKATVAIIVSVLSACVSAFALGWNIYRDVYLKGRLRLVFGLYLIHHDSLPEPIWRYSFSATNLGPGKVKLTTLALRDYSIWKRITRSVTHAIVIHDSKHPFGGPLPCDLDVGEKMDLTFAPDDCTWLGEGFTQIGINDSFGRTHWCNEKYMLDAKKTFLEKKWIKQDKP